MKKVEFIIIGQGLAGTLLAFEMLKAGIDFKIASSSHKSRSSMVAAGMINPLVFKRLTKSWMVDELFPPMKETYKDLENTLQKNFYFDKKIVKPLNEQEKELWTTRMQNPELSVYIEAVLDHSPVKYLHPASAYGLVSQAGYLDLQTFLNAAEDYFREKNLMIDTNVAIEKHDIRRPPFSLGDILCENIVFCEGYHLISNSLFDLVKLRPVKGEVLKIMAPDMAEDYILNKKVFVLPIGKQCFKVGSTYDWKDLSESTSDAGKKSILERLNYLISANYRVFNHQAGIRPTVIDRRPVLGRHPEFANIFVFNGLGTKGVMLAPYFAKQMLHCISNPNYSFNPEVDVQRFYTATD